MKQWPNPSLAEELTQKTVFDALRAREGYDPLKGSPQAWLYKIARNNMALEVRKRNQQTSANGQLLHYLNKLGKEPLPDEIIEKNETAVIVKNALDRLNEKERYVLKAKYINGLTAGAISENMKITEKAVHSLLYRARMSLRKKLRLLARDLEISNYEKS